MAYDLKAYETIIKGNYSAYGVRRVA